MAALLGQLLVLAMLGSVMSAMKTEVAMVALLYKTAMGNE